MDNWREKAKEIIAKMRKLEEEAKTVLLDEMSEARAYRDLAIACKEDDIKWKLAIIAMDSILHREIMWAILRAATSIEMFLTDLLRGAPITAKSLDELLEEIKQHKSIEGLAEASYSDLKNYSEPGTSMYKLLELLQSEETKHDRIVAEIINTILKKERRSVKN